MAWGVWLLCLTGFPVSIPVTSWVYGPVFSGQGTWCRVGGYEAVGDVNIALVVATNNSFKGVSGIGKFW